MPPAPQPLGFIGLGQMGSLMAERLTAWPGGLTVYDVRPDAAGPLVERGAQRAASVEEVAHASEIIGVMVVDDDQVDQVVNAILPVARAGTVITVHSTIRVATAERLADEANRREIVLLDAPVSGGAVGAAAGTLALLVGGDRAAFESIREPFGLCASLIVHFGPAGAGTRAKLARNLVNFVGFAAALEATRLAAATGVDIAKLSRVTTHSDSVTGGPGVVMIRDNSSPLEADDPLRPIFAHTSSLGEKDLALALELGDEAGVSLPLAETAQKWLADYLGVPHAG